jgi:hypothetical protein
VAQGSTAFIRVFLGPSSADKLYAIASNYSANSCFGKNTGKANAEGYRSGVFASGISAAGANRGVVLRLGRQGRRKLFVLRTTTPIYNPSGRP